MRTKQDEDEKGIRQEKYLIALEIQEYALRRSIFRKEGREKYTLEKLSADLEAKEELRRPKLPQPKSLSELYSLPELDKSDAADFLDQYDCAAQVDLNLDTILEAKTNLKEVSSLSQRHRNPKCQANVIEYDEKITVLLVCWFLALMTRCQ